MRKHYRIVSVPRFLAFIFICIILVLAVIYMISGFFKAGEGGGTSSKQLHPDNNASYTEVTVAPGDTLWSIARDHYGSRIDKRQIIYEIRSINDLNDTFLYAGQIIRLPERI